MDDMNTFERSVADEMLRRAGPDPAVDDAAIFAAITDASPRWRFQSMFSATKFVVAGVIVALFGGLLLAGVLTQPSEESVPAATTSGPGTFSPAGSLSAERDRHTATLLPDGRLLVVGGWGGDDLLASAEVWDPETASFEPAGTLSGVRANHTATLLPDGRVFVVGGEGTGRPLVLASAEVWDPATASFSPAGTLAEYRWLHTATQMLDGRVLILGGTDGHWTGEGSYASPEVWDPVAASFRPTASLAENRAGHTATLLPDGRVLVVGGRFDDDWRSSAEVWDPATASFGPAGTLAEERDGHTATLLTDRRVLVVGGRIHRGLVASAEVWNP